MTEGIEIQTMPDLTKRILDQWKKKQEEALAQQKEQEKKLKTAIQEEKELTEKLKMARTIAAKMQGEYSQLESETEIKKRKQIEKDVILESDVKAGKASFKDFVQKGKRESEISKLASEETMKELSKGLEAIRSKNIEILQFEESLLETQIKIRFLLIAPGQILQKVLKDLGDFTDREMGLFLEDINSSRTALDLTKHKLHLTQGRALSPGYSWPWITLKEAHQIQFDPILPLECVEKLKTELKKFKDVGKVNVIFYLKSKDIQVTSFTLGGKK